MQNAEALNTVIVRACVDGTWFDVEPGTFRVVPGMQDGHVAYAPQEIAFVFDRPGTGTFITGRLRSITATERQRVGGDN